MFRQRIASYFERVFCGPSAVTRPPRSVPALLLIERVSGCAHHAKADSLLSQYVGLQVNELCLVPRVSKHMPVQPLTPVHRKRKVSYIVVPWGMPANHTVYMCPWCTRRPEWAWVTQLYRATHTATTNASGTNGLKVDASGSKHACLPAETRQLQQAVVCRSTQTHRQFRPV